MKIQLRTFVRDYSFADILIKVYGNKIYSILRICPNEKQLCFPSFHRSIFEKKKLRKKKCQVARRL